MAVDTSELLFGSVDKGEYTGKVSNFNKKKPPSSKLGKDEFLQLLVAQMQYQDPLEPTSNTEYIAQLATFSQVEQLQNLNTAYTNTQAYTLVGQTVTVTTSQGSESGNVSTVEGVVDFVQMKDGEAQLSINGKLYPATDVSVIKSLEYAYEESKPSVSKAVWSYNGDSPSDVKVAVDLGSGVAEAKKAALMIDSNYAIQGDDITIEDGVMTVSKDALAKIPNGTYKVTVVFDDAQSTNETDKITLTVYNSKAQVEDNKQEETDGGEETDKDTNSES